MNKIANFQIESEKQLIEVCMGLDKMLNHSNIVLLNGDMAAGKTTLVKAYCKYKNVKDLSTSPSFGLVNEYQIGEKKLYHFDLYRVNEEEELYDIGFEEYLDSGNICFIEWPEIGKNFITESYILVNLLVVGEKRIVELKLIE